MKRLLFCAILAIICLLNSQVFCHNLNISDYDTTVSGAQETRINLSYNRSESINAQHQATQDNSSTSLIGQYNNFYDSLNNSWNFTLAGLYANSHLAQESTDTFDNTDRSISIVCNYSNYFIPEASIYNGFGLNYQSDFFSGSGNSIQNYFTTLSYKIGIGHAIDITSLAEAGVLEDRLIDAGSLKERLSKEDMLKLAEIIRRFRMNEYAYKNQDTAKGLFLKDLTNVLEASGKLARPLGGFGFWRISESRQVSYLRTKGYIFELSGSVQTHVNESRPIGGFSSDYNNYLTAKALYYLPIDWRSQANFEASYSPAIDHSGFYPENSSTLSLSYTYDLTNWIWLSLSGTASRNNFKSLSQSDSNSTKQLGASFNYKVEDFTYFSVGYTRSSYDSCTAFSAVSAQQVFYF